MRPLLPILNLKTLPINLGNMWGETLVHQISPLFPPNGIVNTPMRTMLKLLILGISLLVWYLTPPDPPSKTTSHFDSSTTD